MTSKRVGKSPKALTLPAGKFKDQCLALMDQVSKSGEQVFITKRGEIIALAKINAELATNITLTLPDIFNINNPVSGTNIMAYKAQNSQK
jgi:hypothetical protein